MVALPTNKTKRVNAIMDVKREFNLFLGSC